MIQEGKKKEKVQVTQYQANRFKKQRSKSKDGNKSYPNLKSNKI